MLENKQRKLKIEAKSWKMDTGRRYPVRLRRPTPRYPEFRAPKNRIPGGTLGPNILIDIYRTVPTEPNRPNRTDRTEPNRTEPTEPNRTEPNRTVWCEVLIAYTLDNVTFTKAKYMTLGPKFFCCSKMAVTRRRKHLFQ